MPICYGHFKYHWICWIKDQGSSNSLACTLASTCVNLLLLWSPLETGSFSYASWPSVYLLWRNVYLGLRPIFGLGCLCVFLFVCFVFLRFIFLLINWLIDWLLCWVFVSVLGLSLVVASGGHSSSWCAGLSLSWPLLLRSTGSRHAGSVIVAHGPSRSAACGIFPDQGSNPCPLH